MKKMIGSVCLFALLTGTNVMAYDDPSDGYYMEHQSMPQLKAGEYGTDVDNEDNKLTGKADGDMDTYIFNTNSKHPIEFNIFINKNVNQRGAILEMNVYDIDLPEEIDDVFLNGKKVGSLIGANNKWGINRFTIPPGLLKQGKNLVQVYVDKKNKGHWATSIDYAIISGLKVREGGIMRCWVAPTHVNAGEYVNFFAEISGTPKSVQLYNGDIRLPFKLQDPDGDHIYSVQYKVPAYMGKADKGWKENFRIRAAGKWGVSWCPGFKVDK